MHNQTAHWLRRPLGWTGALTLSILAIGGCSDNPSAPDVAGDETTTAEARGGGPGAQGADQVYEFAPPVFDIAAAPNGNIFLAETVNPGLNPAPGEVISTVKEIVTTGAGGVRTVVDIATVSAEGPGLGSPINGLEMVGRGSFFATSGALDLAVGAGLWRVSPGGARLVADIEAFETNNDPDALEGPRWKTPACEVPGGFSAGPQSNPYHLTQHSGSTALVADAAGNTVLSARTNGQVDWVAVLTPPTPSGSSSSDPADWLVQFPLDADTDCYVQPVPTSVAIGPDGDYYVGELTGSTAFDIGIPGATVAATGLARVWRIDAGARNVVCPSPSCEQVLSGFTSIIDVAFGPDGRLYVVEYDEAGWWGVAVLGSPTGGTITACDVSGGPCEIIEANLDLPSAITFDKRGSLWVLENNIGLPFVGSGAPTVRRLN